MYEEVNTGRVQKETASSKTAPLIKSGTLYSIDCARSRLSSDGGTNLRCSRNGSLEDLILRDQVADSAGHVFVGIRRPPDFHGIAHQQFKSGIGELQASFGTRQGTPGCRLGARWRRAGARCLRGILSRLRRLPPLLLFNQDQIPRLQRNFLRFRHPSLR